MIIVTNYSDTIYKIKSHTCMHKKREKLQEYDVTSDVFNIEFETFNLIVLNRRYMCHDVSYCYYYYSFTVLFSYVLHYTIHS